MTASIRRSGARADGTINTREPLINAVTDNKPKMLTGLNQKGTWLVQKLPVFSAADLRATGE
jgi:hypothetical protein